MHSPQASLTCPPMPMFIMNSNMNLLSQLNLLTIMNTIGVGRRGCVQVFVSIEENAPANQLRKLSCLMCCFKLTILSRHSFCFYKKVKLKTGGRSLEKIISVVTCRFFYCFFKICFKCYKIVCFLQVITSLKKMGGVYVQDVFSRR